METYLTYFFAPLSIAGAGALLYLAYRDELLFLKLAQRMLIPLAILASSILTWGIFSYVARLALIEALPKDAETVESVLADLSPGALPVLLIISVAVLLELGLVVVRHRVEARKG